MNRDRYIPRIVRAGDGQLVQIPDGGDGAEAQALALATLCTPELLSSLLRHVAAINEFGGEFYVAAARKKIADGEIVAEDDPGGYETVGYIISYSKRAQIKSQAPEPDVRHMVAGQPPGEVEGEPDAPRATQEPPVPVGTNSGTES